MKCTIKLNLPSFTQELETTFDTEEKTPAEFLREIISAMISDQGKCSIKLEPQKRHPVVHEMEFSQFDFGWTLSRMAARFDQNFCDMLEGKEPKILGNAGMQPKTRELT